MCSLLKIESEALLTLAPLGSMLINDRRADNDLEHHNNQCCSFESNRNHKASQKF